MLAKTKLMTSSHTFDGLEFKSPAVMHGDRRPDRILLSNDDSFVHKTPRWNEDRGVEEKSKKKFVDKLTSSNVVIFCATIIGIKKTRTIFGGVMSPLPENWYIAGSGNFELGVENSACTSSCYWTWRFRHCRHCGYCRAPKAWFGDVASWLVQNFLSQIRQSSSCTCRYQSRWILHESFVTPPNPIRSKCVTWFRFFNPHLADGPCMNEEKWPGGVRLAPHTFGNVKFSCSHSPFFERKSIWHW